MYEWVLSLGAAWRTVVHISEWSGLSIGALAAGAALFVYGPPIGRKLLIAGAVTVVVGWVCLIHGDQVGRADLQKQWDDAKAAAVEAQKARDADIGRELEARYQPKLEGLQKQAEERKARADAYEQKIADLSKRRPANGACELGAAADRLRRRQAR